MIRAECLQWDSDFFRVKVGRLFITQSELLGPQGFVAVERAMIGYDLVYCAMVEGGEIKGDDFVAAVKDQWNCTYKGGNVVYQLDLETQVTGELQVEGQESDRRELVRLALQAGEFSRFRQDEHLRPFFDRLYTLWMERSLSKELADVVLVRKVNDVLSGMVTIKKEGMRGAIKLVAVSDACRGKGIGTSLLQDAKRWCAGQGITVLTVATQSENLLARSFYEKNGFDVLSVERLYHLWS